MSEDISSRLGRIEEGVKSLHRRFDRIELRQDKQGDDIRGLQNWRSWSIGVATGIGGVVSAAWNYFSRGGPT